MCAAVDDPQPVRLLVDVQVHHKPTIHLALIWRVAIPVWAAVAGAVAWPGFRPIQ